jgi:2-keto-4-pentenoate hydratase/2-oxohepta-3-ene-1,7-dioic acid hydratase in catechol pathway
MRSSSRAKRSDPGTKGIARQRTGVVRPRLTIIEPDEVARLDRLDQRLSVNDALRQDDTTANRVFKPAETISELSTFADIAPMCL